MATGRTERNAQGTEHGVRGRHVDGMDGLVEFKVDGSGTPVLFEAAGDDESAGARLVARGTGPVQASATFETALDSVRSAAQSALRVLRDGPLSPDGVEIEFGVKLSAEAGAFITKGTAEGHLVVRLTWTPASPADGQPGQGRGELRAQPQTTRTGHDDPDPADATATTPRTETPRP
ncbi:CU044_2847 family protein [Streptomyces sp. NPDC052225]|uniref:CU044_2847 family protein n=1 Tax=Streptomyces sp. NPDC052225 TaxID=3154949 RepID=UPI003441B9D8